jgi:membrane associated rhomboid family serine protease
MQPWRSLNLGEKLRRIFLGAILGLAAAVILTFLTDFALFRLRLWTNRDPYGSVTVRHYYAVLQKNGKTQFIFDPPQPWRCVNAMFPHSGSLPCWYLQEHPEQRTDI